MLGKFQSQLGPRALLSGVRLSFYLVRAAPHISSKKRGLPQGCRGGTLRIQPIGTPGLRD